jgi:catechol 2,3-dioxygenase-like lactoylglutathione lyase family enzyme
MGVLRAVPVVQSTDRAEAIARYEQLLGAEALDEFPVGDRNLVVTVFPGISLLTGPAEALASFGDLHCTVFVDSLVDTSELLGQTGWTKEGSLGGAGSLVARDPDGNLFEFVQAPHE